MSFNLSVTAQDLNAAIAKANAAAPQSTTYTKAEVDTALAGKQATLTTAQQNAVNSGIDSTMVGQIGTNADDITALKNGGIISAVFGIGEEIPDNSDLDDYATPGTFYVSSSSHAATIAHIPAGGSGFRLLVYNTYYSNRVRQEFIKPNEPGAIYARNVLTDGTWSSWYKFEGTAVTT